MQQFDGAAQVLQLAGAAQPWLCLPNSPPCFSPPNPPNLQPCDGAQQLGAHGFGQQLLAIGAAHAGAAGAGQQLLAAGAAQAGAAGAGQQLAAGAAQAGAAGAQQAGFGAGQQLFAGAAHPGAQVLPQLVPQPCLCPRSLPSRPPRVGPQQVVGQQLSQHGGLMSEQRR